MNKKGFTLIELLVVIVILAIIALITVPNALAMITTAQTRANERSAASFKKAAEAYCLAHTTAPTTLNALPVNITSVNFATEVVKLDLKGAAPTTATVNFATGCVVTGTATYGGVAITL